MFVFKSLDLCFVSTHVREWIPFEIPKQQLSLVLWSLNGAAGAAVAAPAIIPAVTCSTVCTVDVECAQQFITILSSGHLQNSGAPLRPFVVVADSQVL